MEPEQVRHPAWLKLRQCWLDLVNLDNTMPQLFKRDPNQPDSRDPGLIMELTDSDAGRTKMEERATAHQAVLNELVAAGQIKAAVAEHVQQAFAEATYHVWRSHVLITCYRPTELGFGYMKNRGDLVQQGKLLIELAGDNSIDQDAIAQAQAAISRDLAFFQAAATLQAEEQKWGGPDWEAQGELVEQAKSGKIKVGPEAEAASRAIIELLQGGS